MSRAASTRREDVGVPFFQVLEGWTPPARPAGAAVWTMARILEGSTADFGSAVAIESYFPLVPAYTDPTDPPTYTFETDSAQLDSGWYWVEWRDAAATEAPAGPVELRTPSPYQPSVADVASHVRLMLREVGGTLMPNFTDQTLPTAAQVQGMIANDFPLVLIHTGDLSTLPCTTASDIRAAAKAIAAERVALQVLETYRMEEVAAGTLGVDQRRTQLNADMDALVAAVLACRGGQVTPDPGGGGGTTQTPAWWGPAKGNFARGGLAGLRTRW
jgi:hypothetical protein